MRDAGAKSKMKFACLQAKNETLAFLFLLAFLFFVQWFFLSRKDWMQFPHVIINIVSLSFGRKTILDLQRSCQRRSLSAWHANPKTLMITKKEEMMHLLHHWDVISREAWRIIHIPLTLPLSFWKSLTRLPSLYARPHAENSVIVWHWLSCYTFLDVSVARLLQNSWQAVQT